MIMDDEGEEKIKNKKQLIVRRRELETECKGCTHEGIILPVYHGIGPTVGETRRGG